MQGLKTAVWGWEVVLDYAMICQVLSAVEGSDFRMSS